MPTTISNPATFSSVRNAFNTEGYGISTSFLAYRQGGGIVPATSAFNAIGAGTGPPQPDPLQLTQFNGFTVPSQLAVSLGNHALDGVSDAVDPISSTIYFTLDSSGIASVDYSSTSGSAELTIDSVPQIGTGTFNIETWLDGGSSSDIEVYVTQTSGSTLLVGSSALGTYLNLGTTRQWGLQSVRSTLGSQSKACTLSVSFVQASNRSNVLDTATINLSVLVSYTT